MNRAQRRAEIKNLQKRGVKREVARTLVEHYYSDIPLEEGTRVKINYDFIVRHPDWKIQRDDYKAWIEEHKDETFTVVWDEKRKANNTRDKKINVCFAEDTTEPKWLFNTATLMPVATAKIKMNDGTESELEIITNNSEKLTTEKINQAVNEALERENIDINNQVVQDNKE